MTIYYKVAHDALIYDIYIIHFLDFGGQTWVLQLVLKSFSKPLVVASSTAQSIRFSRRLKDDRTSENQKTKKKSSKNHAKSLKTKQHLKDNPTRKKTNKQRIHPTEMGLHLPPERPPARRSAPVGAPAARDAPRPRRWAPSPRRAPGSEEERGTGMDWSRCFLGDDFCFENDFEVGCLGGVYFLFWTWLNMVDFRVEMAPLGLITAFSQVSWGIRSTLLLLLLIWCSADVQMYRFI